METLPFSAKGYSLRKTNDREYIISCVKEATILSVEEKEKNFADLWIDDAAKAVTLLLDSKNVENEAFELLFNDQRIGMLWMGITADEFTCEKIGYVLGIYIRPEDRGKGLGRKLLESAESWCKSNNLIHISLNVGTANKDVVKLYKSEGFEERSIVMRKLI